MDQIQKIIDKARKRINEDAPVCIAGGGAIAGIGIGAQGEPPGNQSKIIKKMLRRKKVITAK